MPAYRFYQLDVFTTQPLAGNPLAVFPHADGLDQRTMQALAREMNLSETTFVFPSSRATRRVRFFTPTAEIPLAGHPTIGTWWLLAERGDVPTPTQGQVTLHQETGAGVLPVHVTVHGSRVRTVEMVQARPAFGSPFPDRLALSRALGGTDDAVADDPPPQVVSTALPQLMVPIRSRAALAALPSGGRGGELAALLREVGTDCAMCFAATETAARWHCRMFAPALGVPEDPATGSAAGALGCYLVHHRLLGSQAAREGFVIEQGAEIARPSRIHVRVDTDGGGQIREVRVGGEAVTVIEGEVRL